jgi:hypothetical protein
LNRLDLRAHVHADEERADHLAAGVRDGPVLRDVTLAEQRGETGEGSACNDQTVGRAFTVEQRADGPAAVLLLQRRGDAHEVVAGAREYGGDGAAALQELVGDREVHIEDFVAGFNGGCRDAVDVDFLRFVERVRGRQQTGEQCHRTANFG